MVNAISLYVQQIKIIIILKVQYWNDIKKEKLKVKEYISKLLNKVNQKIH